jgi:hypothetical protein
MWRKIMARSPIWYFDATGSILKKPSGDGPAQLYSVVCYDDILNKYVPVFEFASTKHTSIHIRLYLDLARSYLDIYSSINASLLPRVIVVDQSWAMINAIIKCFNNCSIIEYLQKCYSIIVTDQTNSDLSNITLPNIVPYLCSTHFLKSFICKAKKAATKKVASFSSFCFALLQSSTDFEQFNNYLLHIQNIFTSKFYCDSVQYSRRILISAIQFRGLREIKTTYNDNSLNMTDLTKFKWSDDMCGTQNTITASSPFTAYFNQKIHDNAKKIQARSSDPQASLNTYFNVKIFEFVQAKLHILPLWTGHLIKLLREKYPNQFDSDATRLTNNRVEAYFGHLKRNILQKRNNLYCSELSAKLYDALQFCYFENYKDGANEMNKLSDTENHQTSSNPKNVVTVYVYLNDCTFAALFFFLYA